MLAPEWKQWNATSETWEAWATQDLPNLETLFLHPFLVQFYKRIKYLESISGNGSLGVATLDDMENCMKYPNRYSIQSEDLWSGFYPTLAPAGWLAPKSGWDTGGSTIDNYEDALEDETEWNTLKTWLDNADPMAENEHVQFNDGTYYFRKRLSYIRELIDRYQVYMPQGFYGGAWGGVKWFHTIEEGGTEEIGEVEGVSADQYFRYSVVQSIYGAKNQTSQHQSFFPKDVVVPANRLKGGGVVIIGVSRSTSDPYVTNPNVNGEEVYDFGTSCKMLDEHYAEENDFTEDWPVNSGYYHKPGSQLLPVYPDDIDPPWSLHELAFKLVYLMEKYVTESWYPEQFRVSYPSGVPY